MLALMTEGVAKVGTAVPPFRSYGIAAYICAVRGGVSAYMFGFRADSKPWSGLVVMSGIVGATGPPDHTVLGIPGGRKYL